MGPSGSGSCLAPLHVPAAQGSWACSERELDAGAAGAQGAGACSSLGKAGQWGGDLYLPPVPSGAL